MEFLYLCCTKDFGLFKSYFSVSMCFYLLTATLSYGHALISINTPFHLLPICLLLSTFYTLRSLLLNTVMNLWMRPVDQYDNNENSGHLSSSANVWKSYFTDGFGCLNTHNYNNVLSNVHLYFPLLCHMQRSVFLLFRSLYPWSRSCMMFKLLPVRHL